jgi:hypothetical protein
MREASYLRAQAELSLQLAQQMSDPHSAARLRAAAAKYHAEAEALEAASRSTQEPERGASK